MFNSPALPSLTSIVGPGCWLSVCVCAAKSQLFFRRSKVFYGKYVAPRSKIPQTPQKEDDKDVSTHHHSAFLGDILLFWCSELVEKTLSGATMRHMFIVILLVLLQAISTNSFFAERCHDYCGLNSSKCLSNGRCLCVFGWTGPNAAYITSGPREGMIVADFCTEECRYNFLYHNPACVGSSATITPPTMHPSFNNPPTSCKKTCGKFESAGRCLNNNSCLCWWGWTGNNAMYVNNGPYKNRIVADDCMISCHYTHDYRNPDCIKDDQDEVLPTEDMDPESIHSSSSNTNSTSEIITDAMPDEDALTVTSEIPPSPSLPPQSPHAACDPKCERFGQGKCLSDGSCLCWWGWTGPNATYITTGNLTNRIKAKYCTEPCHYTHDYMNTSCATIPTPKTCDIPSNSTPQLPCLPRCGKGVFHGECLRNGRCLCWWGWTGPHSCFVDEGDYKNRIIADYCEEPCHYTHDYRNNSCVKSDDVPLANQGPSTSLFPTDVSAATKDANVSTSPASVQSSSTEQPTSTGDNTTTVSFNTSQHLVTTDEYMALEELSTTEQPITTEEQPIATEGQPTTAEEQPITTEEQPTPAEEQLTTTEEQTVTTEEQPIATEEQPTTAEEQPITTGEQVIATDEQPTIAEEQPITVEQQTITTELQSITTEEQPIATEEQPTTAEEKPITVEEQPTTAEEQSTTVEEQHITTKEQDPLTEEQPTATEPQPTTTGEQTQAIQSHDFTESTEPANVDEPSETEKSKEATELPGTAVPTEERELTGFMEPTEETQTEPSDPNESNRPTELEEFTETTELTRETEPTLMFTEPTKEIETTDWQEWLAATEPTEDTVLIDPTLATEATVDSRPTEPVELSEAAETDEVTEPTEAEEPTEIESTKQAETTEPVELSETAATDELTEPTEAEEPTEVKSIKQAETTEPTERADATEPIQSNEPTELSNEPEETNEFAEGASSSKERFPAVSSKKHSPAASLSISMVAIGIIAIIFAMIALVAMVKHHGKCFKRHLGYRQLGDNTYFVNEREMSDELAKVI